MLKIRRLVIVVAISASLFVGLVPAAFAQWSFDCPPYQPCQWSLIDGGPKPFGPEEHANYFPDQDVPDPDPCYYIKLYPQPDPGPAWQGQDPEHGRLWQTWCPDALYISEHDPDGNNRRAPTYMGTYYVPDGTPPGQGDAIDPMVLVARASGNLTIPTPEPHFGPDAGTVAVKVPVWLWIDYQGPIVKTATAGALTATVTARLESTTWQMGEPVDVDAPATAAPPVTCTGAGAPFRAGMDPSLPPCGYTYVWRSLAERTAGSGTWAVTVTAHWTIRWTVSSGESGSQQITTTATAPLLVREWHVVLVDKPGG